MGLTLAWQPITLNLKTTFRIAHGASDQRFNVAITLDDGEFTGMGEAAAVAYHGESQAGIIAYLAGLEEKGINWSNLTDPFLLEDTISRLPAGSNAGRAAVDLALHDLWGKHLGQPLYRLLGLNPTFAPETSFTIAIAEPAKMAEAAASSAWPIIKIKVGGEDDEEIVSAIRRATNARLRVDANGGWSRQQAASLIPRLAEYGLELVEQPLASGDIEGCRWLRGLHLGTPIFADESIKSSRDVVAHAGAVDGVVIKLMKSGGIREAVRSIHTAKALDMQVMISCMVETSLGVTAAAHLAPLCDFVDLDGPLLIQNDPFDGIRYSLARILLPDRPGLGVSSHEYSNYQK